MTFSLVLSTKKGCLSEVWRLSHLLLCLFIKKINTLEKKVIQYLHWSSLMQATKDNSRWYFVLCKLIPELHETIRYLYPSTFVFLYFTRTFESIIEKNKIWCIAISNIKKWRIYLEIINKFWLIMKDWINSITKIIIISDEITHKDP